MKNKKVLAFFLLFLVPAISAKAYWVWSPEQGKFVNAEGKASDAAQDDFDYAMKFYREKNLDEAQKRFEDILKKYPQSKVAPEALYRLGYVLEEKEDYLKAFKHYRKLVESYPQSERFNEVIEREYRIGNVFLGGKKAKFAGIEILPSVPKAVEIFQHIVKNAPYSDYGDKAQFQLGLAFKKWRHYGEAVEAFQAVIDQYPKSELLSQARYELAESAFLKSASNVRDQRSLDDASKQVDKFLNRYPDANTAEKAAKIRQEIDEKNAEKNYRIGLYYEKDSYIESALIYYQDVATRYPATQWGQKAGVKLKSLKNPGKYISEENAALDEQAREFETKLKNLEADKNSVDYQSTQRSLERIQKRRKTLDKDKKESLERRKADLGRREKEYKQKVKNLNQKKKLLAKNQSEDLKNAIDRWEASLNKEKEALGDERQQLMGWREDLGVSDKKIDLSMLPFVGREPSELEKIQQIEAKKFFKLSEEKKSLLEEKETLYRHHSEVSSLLSPANSTTEPTVSAGPDAQKIHQLQSEIENLEKDLTEKSQAYEKQYGKSLLSSFSGGVKKSFSKSLNILNPFDSPQGPQGEQQILERQMHLKEQIAAQEALVHTLSQALDAQLALQEQRRLMNDLGVKEKADPNELRKEVRNLERKIRAGYEEIEERDKNKKVYLKQLSLELKDREKKDNIALWATRKAVSPATGTAKLMKAFFVGLPHEDVNLTKSAAKLENGPDTANIKALEAKIKDESLLMEAKSREITSQRKELEILKAKAQLAGGYKFRSVFIDVPYLFFNEAMESARRIVPKKNREAMLVSRMDDETKKLQQLKEQLTAVDSQVDKLSGASPIKASEEKGVLPAKNPNSAAPQETLETQSAVSGTSEDILKKDLEILHQQIQTKQLILDQEKISAGKKNGVKGEVSGTEGLTSKQAKKLEKELHEIEEDLKKVIKKENELESEESEILTKRISRIDKTMKKIHSKAVTQDLLTEKERIEERLSQLETRQNFLTQELKRFEPMPDNS